MGLSKKEATEVLSSYNLGKIKSIKRLTKGYSNENYKVKTTTRKVLYRTFVYNDKAEIKYELALLRFLKKKKFPAAYPIANNANRYISKSKHGKVVIYEFIPGNEPTPSKKVVKEIGTALGRLNSFKKWKKYQRKNPIGFDFCALLIEQFDTASHQYPKIFKHFKVQSTHLKSLATADLPKGLIHADIFTDNTIFKKKKLQAILDFEEACTDVLMIEIGVAINGFCFKNDKLDLSLVKAFLTAYEKQRPMTKEEKILLPKFIQWGTHAILGWHLKILLEDKSLKRLNRVKYLVDRAKYLRIIEKGLSF